MGTNFLKTEKEIKEWLGSYGLKSYVIAEDPHYGYVVNTSADVKLGDKGLKEIPVKFGHVAGNFHVPNNLLTSLDFAPSWARSFYAQHNCLKSLKGSPQYVEGSFYCGDNPLGSLEGGPQAVGSYYCERTEIESFEFVAKEISYSLTAIGNKIKSLEFVPDDLQRNLNVMFNDIEDLSFFPKNVGGVVCLRENPKLGSLQQESSPVILTQHHIDLLRVRKERSLLQENINSNIDNSRKDLPSQKSIRKI